MPEMTTAYYIFIGAAVLALVGFAVYLHRRKSKP